MKAISIITASVLALLAQSAVANTVTSDACAAGVRDFAVTASTVVGCLAVGAGNINGNSDAFQQLHPGWTFIDASDNGAGAHNGWLSSQGSLTSGLSGDFIVNAAAYTTYDRIAIAFKSGAGQADPDWAVFELADNTLSGSWTISGAQALSHALIYGFGTPTVVVAAVAEPDAISLLGLGALLVAARRRRR